MTLRLIEDGTVVTVLLPEPIRNVPDGVALHWADRKHGLLLHGVSSASAEDVGGRTRRQCLLCARSGGTRRDKTIGGRRGRKQQSEKGQDAQDKRHAHRDAVEPKRGHKCKIT